MRRRVRPPCPSVLESLLRELPPRDEARTRVAVPGQRALVLAERRGVVTALELRGPDGAVELTLEFAPEGLRARLHAATLELDAVGELALRCDRFALQAERGARIEAPRGAIELDAGDDVVVTGERILLN
ncbi:MAG: hypothetical protein K1X88_04240 [Nannocystaceae bacterium]|nr:hypothetical protein [Nannocystaceae bacterium]